MLSMQTGVFKALVTTVSSYRFLFQRQPLAILLKSQILCLVTAWIPSKGTVVNIIAHKAKHKIWLLIDETLVILTDIICN